MNTEARIFVIGLGTLSMAIPALLRSFTTYTWVSVVAANLLLIARHQID